MQASTNEHTLPRVIRRVWCFNCQKHVGTVYLTAKAATTAAVRHEAKTGHCTSFQRNDTGAR